MLRLTEFILPPKCRGLVELSRGLGWRMHGSVEDTKLSTNKQHSLSNEFVGVEVNACMRLVHFLIVQGLGLTKDWNVKKHDNASKISSIHLRNLSHMSLGLLSVFLHTCCDKALIPVNSGKIRLMALTPEYQETSMAFIEYDTRLHTETHQNLMGGTSDNMLSVASRMAL